MNWLDKIVNGYATWRNKSVIMDTLGNVSGLSSTSPKYITNSSITRYITGTGVTFQTACYNYCPHLQSIIAKKAGSLIRGNIIPVNPDDNSVIKNNPAFNKDMKLLSRPNQFQSGNEFIRMMDTLLNVYGVCYVYKIVSIGFKEPTGFIIIPNPFISVTYKSSVNILDNQSRIVDTYSITLYGVTITLRGDDVELIQEIRDTTINTSYPFQPKSRIDGLEYPVKNIVASLESRNQIIVRRGAEIAISPKNGDTAAIMKVMTPKEKEELQAEYANYGTLSSQNHALIARVPMDITSISRPIQALGLFDGENADHRTLVQAFGVPVPLLGMPDTTKFSTYSEAKKEFYDDTIIPESQVVCDGLNELFGSVGKSYSFFFDYSMLSCMQRSEKDKADALGRMVKALSDAVSAGLIDINEAKNQIKDYLNG